MEQKIKRRTAIILIGMLVICASLAAGAIYLYNDIFPKAGPIRCPGIEQITSVTLGCNTPDGSISMAEQYYEDILQHIGSAEPTRKQAINDYPAGKIYYSVDIHADDRTYRYFVYEEGEQVFIEVPYEGIYASETELLDLVLDTYLIYPEYYKTIVELLNLHISSLVLLDIVKRTKSIELHPAVVYIPRHAEKYRWMPLLCYKSGEEFYHIQYHDGWMCRNCRTNNGPVIMPMFEADTTYYQYPLPPISEIFHKVNCKKCGKPLQNHLIMVDEV